MNINNKILYSFIKDEIDRAVRVNSKILNSHTIAANIIENIESKRYTLVPTYLTDQMYHSQLIYFSELPYILLNDMYKAAIQNVYSESRPVVQCDFDDGYFW